MWKKIKSLLGGEPTVQPGPQGSDPGRPAQDRKVAVAAVSLLAEAARVDGSFDEEERARIDAIAQQYFGFDKQAAHHLLEEAEKRAEKSVDLHSFTRVLMKEFEYEERLEVIENLWEVVYADGALHDFEANLMRRITGLLHVSDKDSGNARKRVQGRLKQRAG